MKRTKGFALITTLLILALLLSLMGVFFVNTNIELAAMRHSKGTLYGFYAAEAGLNIRAEDIRQIFVGFNRPAGTEPNLDALGGAGTLCKDGSTGTGDFKCKTFDFNNRDVVTYLTEDPSNPMIITIPPGERYQYLNAQEYRYTANSEAINNQENTEAKLMLQFKTRLVPLFQFAAFYNKDLEILPGPTMTLSGPVHSNGDLYLYSDGSSLTINGQVTTAGGLYRGRKDSKTPNCSNSPVYIYNPSTAQSLIPTCPSRTKVTSSQITSWNGMIQMGVQKLTVPGPEVFDPTPGHIYYDKADIRLVRTLNAADNHLAFEVRKPDDTVDNAATTSLNNATTCPGSLGGKVVATGTFYNYREGKMIKLMDIDMQGLLNCLRSTNWFGSGKKLDDTTEGGIVIHVTHKGPNSSSAANAYGTRIRNASVLQSTAGTPTVKGLSIVSDQAIYTMGHFNSTTKIPAAIMADSINVLSTNWNDSNCTSSSSCAISGRVAANTTINAALLAGTDITGGAEGASGQNGAYNGGLENYPRFHENWTSKTLIYRGSFVSLWKAKHVSGSWGSQSYNAPTRDWNYDTSFNNAANLPPITPRFVYLRQELFVRDDLGE